jgi:hypothetical protein
MAFGLRKLHNVGMAIRRYSRFVSAFWEGLAAPTLLFTSPVPYPYFNATNSVRRSFAKVGSYVNYAVSRHREQSGHSSAIRK